MSIDTTIPRTRRAILVSVIGATVATAAAAVGRATPVGAATGDPVLVGHTYSGTTTTEITTTNIVALAGTSGSGTGVLGYGNSGPGVSGWSSSNAGVFGRSDTFSAIYGRNTATNQPAISGRALGDHIGVRGLSGNNYGTPAVKTGVYGYADQDDSARGVTGETTSGRGVNGIATSGTGVVGKSSGGEGIRGISTGSNGTAGSSASGIASGIYGENTAGGFGTYGRSNVGATGSGVFGESTSGTGVGAATTSGVALRASSSGKGMAIEANGRVTFSTSGLAAVAVGSAARLVAPGCDLVAGSLVLCTLESGQPHLAIQRVTKNTSANTFTIFLSAALAAGHTAKVGWFVIG